MRKIAISLFACALSTLVWAGEPTDIDSLFRGKEYKPIGQVPLVEYLQHCVEYIRVCFLNLIE